VLQYDVDVAGWLESEQVPLQDYHPVSQRHNPEPGHDIEVDGSDLWLLGGLDLPSRRLSSQRIRERTKANALLADVSLVEKPRDVPRSQIPAIS
jgi:hypothetical protein